MTEPEPEPAPAPAPETETEPEPRAQVAFAFKMPAAPRPGAGGAGGRTGAMGGDADDDSLPAPSRDAVVSVGASGVVPAEQKQEEGPLVIAPLANKWQPGDKTSMPGPGVGPSPSSSSRDRGRDAAEGAVSDEQAARALLEDAQARSEVQAQDGGNGDSVMTDVAPIAGGGGANADPDPDGAKFRRDLDGLPDSADDDAYERIPVEAFGHALLRGMGWKPGGTVGRSGAACVQPVEYVPRQGRLGLGAVPKAQPEKVKRFIKPGETRGPKPDLVLPPDANGRQRHFRTLDEKLVPRAQVLGGPRTGANVEIVSGVHEGMRGLIVSTEGETARVRLTASEQEVTVSRGCLSQLALHTGIDDGRKREKEREKEKERERRKKEKERDRGREKGKDRDKERRHHQSEPPPRPWLRPHITVRVVSKRLAEGRYYERKGVVLDVPRPGECTVQIGSSVVEGVRQSMLETALPKPGGRVLALKGKHAGRPGTLLERSSRDARAVVQMDDDGNAVTLSYDDCAELAAAGDSGM